MAPEDETVERVALERLVGALESQLEEYARAAGVRQVDLRALELVVDAAQSTPTELASALRMSSGGTTAVIDRLQSASLVGRSAGAGGRRRVLLAATPEGVQLVARRRSRFEAVVAQVVEGLSLDERRVVQRWFRDLTELVEQDEHRLHREMRAARQERSKLPVIVRWG